MLSRSLPIDTICILCNKTNETADHFFYNCPFAKSIYQHMFMTIQNSKLHNKEMTVVDTLKTIKEHINIIMVVVVQTVEVQKGM
ncbi:unnamed protein product [Cuscuta campestris]|uniref:Reverse transcriptase zinc-binding domain-containing protein n=1 Tax=Cuscuta campestris TaxID=132261 RepID=A0A484NB30_9ASTE|nr:unnamed protein product [Cuscuta campestris]